MEDKKIPYVKPEVEDLSNLASIQGGLCATGSLPGGACTPGNVAIGTCTDGGGVSTVNVPMPPLR